MNEPVWTPSAQRIKQSNMQRFLDYVRARNAPEVTDYTALYRWSVGHRDLFWQSVWQFCDIKAAHPWQQVLSESEAMLGARWFTGSRLNFAGNLLRCAENKPAIIFRGEQGQRRVLSYPHLREQVARLAGAMEASGVQPGDRIAGFLPNIPETVIAMLASASLGAIWSSCSPDFGADGVLDRFGQIAPKLLFAADGYWFKGKSITTLTRVGEITAKIESIKRIILVPFLEQAPATAGLPNAIRWGDYLRSYAGPPPDYAPVPFDAPLYIMYSSGTTGLPKCMVHGAGGTLIQHLKELVLHTDLKPEDVIFYYTTCGWMMWNWLVSGLAAGATVVLYDGSPLYPRPSALFDIAEQEDVSIFGASAKYFAALEKAGVKPKRSHDLFHLNTVLSTGSPLAPEQFDFVYEEIKRDVQLSSISGGTDIISCFALGNPMLPVYRGELQCRGLGMRVEVFDDAGNAVIGEKGELVCTASFPSMPIGFWNDPDQQKYRDAYFSKYPGVWAHGDYAELNQRGGMVIHGRSDATLNPGGVRIGTAEIYRQVEQLPEVLESIAVGQDWQDDTRIILFVRLAGDGVLDDALRTKIATAIREQVSARHVPARIIQVQDIPRTISGKIVELAVRNVIHGRPVTNRDALANPEALALYQDLPELKS